MRYSSWLAIVIMGLCLWSGLEFYHYYKQVSQEKQQIKLRQDFQKAVGLPNLAITTAARYLRHYSITDISTPFQNYPASLDHFPAGFAFAPPDYSNMPELIVFREAQKTSKRNHPKKNYSGKNHSRAKQSGSNQPEANQSGAK